MKTNYIIVLLLLTAALFLLLFHLSANNLEFSRYNNGWNGTAGFFDLPDRHNFEDITNSSTLPGRKNSTLLVVAPTNLYSDRELSEYRSFVKEGNILFLADDFGTGNKLLEGIGSSIRINPGILSSVDRAYNDSYAIVTYPDGDHQITRNVSSLVLNRGAALEGGDPLMKTTLMSWIDTDKDRRITKKEMLGKYTVLTHEPIGKGEIIVLSDPSVFINAMSALDEKWDNRRFIDNVIRNNDHLLVDQINSKTADTDGYSMVMQNLKSSSLFTILFSGLLLFGLIIIIKKRIL